MGKSIAKESKMSSESQPTGESSTLISVSEDPLCREATLISLHDWITPTERFYIRNHFSGVPSLDGSAWRLVIDGEVRQPRTLTLADILAMPAKELVTTMECAGNSRSYVTPPAEGLAFRHGVVSTARWKGVPLRALLDRSGLRDSAVEVVFEGADWGHEEEGGVSFDLSYQRSLPLEKALHLDTLLAYQMNGEPLTALHGFPLRLVVPGWYGMASVKWLTGIHVLNQPFDGFFQQRRYVVINEGREDSLERQPVTALKVKSLISSPRHGEVIQPGRCTIRGFAWSGEGQLNEVKVSTDGGLHWQDATVLGQSSPFAWRQREYVWLASHSGHFVIMARATDSAGHSQPDAIPWNFRGYANNSVHAIAVEVPTVRATSYI
jgi:DMSO/TMAO reductase YedYZ molybdopterin-dependent catalytic subunit